MASKKAIQERLEQIKERAAQENANAKTKGGVTGWDLAEEAAGLALELLERGK